jgi:hypothetical protein
LGQIWLERVITAEIKEPQAHGGQMYCLPFFHKFEIVNASNMDNTKWGYCRLLLRCSRCGQRMVQETKQRHDFDPLPIITYECSREGDHVCTEIKKTVCRTCGFTDTEMRTAFEQVEREECTVDRCKHCGRKLPIERHIWKSVQSGNARIEMEHAWINQSYRALPILKWDAEYRCQECGKTRIDHKSGRDHQYGSWVALSSCTRQRKCRECDCIEVEVNHQWETKRDFDHVWKNEPRLDREGEDIIHTWKEEHICRHCGESKIVDQDSGY